MTKKLSLCLFSVLSLMMLAGSVAGIQYEPVYRRAYGMEYQNPLPTVVYSPERMQGEYHDGVWIQVFDDTIAHKKPKFYGFPEQTVKYQRQSLNPFLCDRWKVNKGCVYFEDERGQLYYALPNRAGPVPTVY